MAETFAPAGILRPVPIPVKSTLEAPRSSSAGLTVPETGESEFTAGRAASEGLTGIGGRYGPPGRAPGVASSRSWR